MANKISWESALVVCRPSLVVVFFALFVIMNIFVLLYSCYSYPVRISFDADSSTVLHGYITGRLLGWISNLNIEQNCTTLLRYIVG